MKDEEYYKDREEEAISKSSHYRDLARRTWNYRTRKDLEDQADSYGAEALRNQRLADEAYEAERLRKKREFESRDEDEEEEED